MYVLKGNICWSVNGCIHQLNLSVVIEIISGLWLVVYIHVHVMFKPSLLCVLFCKLYIMPLYLVGPKVCAVDSQDANLGVCNWDMFSKGLKEQFFNVSVLVTISLFQDLREVQTSW